MIVETVRIARRTASCAGDGSTSSASSPSGSASPSTSATSESFSEARLLPHEREAAPSGSRRADRYGFQKNFSRTLSAHLDGLPETTPIEIWFQDEARIGQKNGVRQWAKRGTRPRQPADQRYDNAYLSAPLSGARCRRALALPYADTEAMQLHLDEISRHVAESAHTVLLLDRAGWHTTGNLDVPKNITPIFLPSRAPELTRSRTSAVPSVELALQPRLDTYDAIIDAACEAGRSSSRSLTPSPQSGCEAGRRRSVVMTLVYLTER